MSEQIQIFPHQQEESKVIGKNTQNGNHIIKVHLLSNVEAGNKNRYNYNDVSELPESFLQELVGLPIISEHNHIELDNLHRQLVAEGKTECEIRHALVEKSKDFAIGILDDVYKPGKLTYNSMIPETELFGAAEIIDPEENAYIEKYGKPSKEFTSIGTLGEYIQYEDGRTVYEDMNKVRPFHIAMAKVPAFGRDRAKVRGVCKGEKTVCKNKLMYQSLDANENINTKENDTINMSKQESVTKVITTDSTDNKAPVKEVESAPVKADHKPGQQEEKEKADQDQILKKPPPEVAEEEQPNKSKNEDNEDAPNKSKKESSELDELRAQLDAVRKDAEDQKRTFRQALLKYNVDPKAFKSEDELNAEKSRVMSIIEGYNLKNEDAEWLVTKAFSRAVEKSPKPIYNSMLYNASDAIKSTGVTEDSAPANKKPEYNLIENEY